VSRWGLSAELREQRPWGLQADSLAPAKVITDPVHKDIHLTKLETRILNSAPVQRLRRVRQLGTSNLVYPGANHSRLSHSLGALHVAQRILDVVEAQRSGPHPMPDLFDEWAAADTPEYPYPKRLAEAIVLGRLGGLLHDMCHIPFGHTLEDDLTLLPAHDENANRFEKLWALFPETLRDELEAGGLKDALRPLIVSKHEASVDEGFKPLQPFLDRPPASRYPFVADVVGNTICADLMDYLPRDHYMTGLPASLGQRFLDGFYVAPSGTYCAERMVMRIGRGTRERADIVTELFKYLRYRYEETERVLVHHTKLAADAMIGKLLAMWSDELMIDALAEFVDLSEDDRKDVARAIETATRADSAAVLTVRAQVGERLEDLFLRRGDDGVLEHIDELYSTPANTCQEAISVLTRRVLDRDLYKLIARAPDTKGMSKEDFFKTFGSADRKRDIERSIADFAQLGEGWHLLLWIPDPKMRLKPADVLVTSDGKEIVKLKSHSKYGAQGSAINEQHMNLWAVSVYAAPDVAQDEKLCAAIRGELSRELQGLKWDNGETFDDAEEAIAKATAEQFRLPREAEHRIADGLRAHNAAALTRRGSSGPTQLPALNVRTYQNLCDYANVLAQSETATEGAMPQIDRTVDDIDTAPGLFDTE